MQMQEQMESSNAIRIKPKEVSMIYRSCDGAIHRSLAIRLLSFFECRSDTISLGRRQSGNLIMISQRWEQGKTWQDAAYTEIKGMMCIMMG